MHRAMQFCYIAICGYASRMIALSRRSLLLRLLMIAPLLFGVLVKPVLGVACDLRDAAAAAVAHATDDGAVQAPADAGGDCCCVPGCDDCCTHSVALVARVDGAVAGCAPASPLPSAVVSFVPAPDPVAFRPPIRA